VSLAPGPDRRRTGGEPPATRQHMPTHNDTRRQGQRYDHGIPAGQAAAVLVFTQQRPWGSVCQWVGPYWPELALCPTGEGLGCLGH
jgi:hypothetical protein